MPSSLHYPARLQPMRQMVALASERVPGFFPGVPVGRLPECRGYHSGCESRHCPACSRRNYYKLEHRLAEAVRKIPSPNLRLATFIAADCPLDELRFTASEVASAGRNMLRQIPSLRGWFLRQEVSRYRDGMFHPHIHVLLDTKPGYHSGRNCMSVRKWEQAWAASLPSDLHRVQSAPVVIARVKDTQDDFRRVLHYICKSPWENSEFDGLEGTVDSAVGITDQVEAMARLRRYADFGSLSIH